MELTYLKEIETLYKCCKPNSYGKGVVTELIENPSDEEKITIAKFTKYMPNIKQWCIDWAGMNLKGAKKDIWKYLASRVDKATGTQAVRATSIPKFLIDALDDMEGEYLEHIKSDPVLDIFQATGKVVHKTKIKTSNKVSKLGLYDDVVKLCKQNNIKTIKTEDLEKIITYLERLCPVSYNKKLFGDLPEHLVEFRRELFQYFQERFPISRSQVLKNPDLFHKLRLGGYKPAELNVNFSEQGDISSYTYRRYLEDKECYIYFNRYSNDNVVVGLGHHQAKIQQPFCADESIIYLERKDITSIILPNIKNNLEIIKKYMDSPKHYYLKKENKVFSFNFDALALDIYYNENILVNPVSLANLKEEDIFNGKEPITIATELSSKI